MDATDEFNSIHSSKAKGMLAQYYIGELVTAEQKASAVAAAAAKGAAANGVVSITANGTAAAVNGAAAAAVNGSGAAELVALDPRKKIAFKLAEKIELSHNVRLFRFALQSAQHKVRRSACAVMFVLKVISVLVLLLLLLLASLAA
jgi:nitrate reductase (NAD(P)H)